MRPVRAPLLVWLPSLLLGCGLALDLDPQGGGGGVPRLDGGSVDSRVADGAPADATTDVLVDAGDAAADAVLACEPDDGARCDGETLVTCVEGARSRTRCLLGCDPERAACRSLRPSNVSGDVDLTGADAELDLDPADFAFVVFDTDTGAIEGFPVEPPANDVAGEPLRPAGTGVQEGIFFDKADAMEPCAAPLGVFAMERLRIRPETRYVGVGDRALVLLVRNEAHIEGTLTVGADLRPQGGGPGPAGGHRATADTPAVGCGAGADGANTGLVDGGGAGGSFGGAGGTGGMMGATGAQAAAPYGGATLVPLIAGSGGGRGGDPALAGPGGHGGGALQLSAGQLIRVGEGGVVDAAGGGGRGSIGVGSPDGGGGGGSGGAILLEAPRVRLETGARVGANGGAGGQGGPLADTPGEDGRAGYAWLAVPAPGSGDREGGGGGGHGSDDSGVAGDGSSNVANGGGGGGGAGRIRINAADPMTDGAILTPSLPSDLATIGRPLAR